MKMFTLLLVISIPFNRNCESNERRVLLLQLNRNAHRLLRRDSVVRLRSTNVNAPSLHQSNQNTGWLVMSEHVLNFGRAAKVTQSTSVKLALSDGCCSTAAEWNALLGWRCLATVYIHIVLCSEHIIPAVTKSHNVATWTAGARLWW
jgi:hypothetical protein